MQHEELNDYLRTIPVMDNDCHVDASDSDNQPLRQLLKNAKGKSPSTDSFMSTLGKRVVAIQLTHTLVPPQHPKCRDVYHVR